MIYRDPLGRPEPKATISVYGSNYGAPGTGYFSISCISDAPDRRWPYTSRDVSHIVAEMEADGWSCTVTKDGYNAPRIRCVHLETLAALAELQAECQLSGEGEPGFIRFGAPPAGGRSTNQVTGESEPGVSVYRATFFDNGYRVDVPHYSQGTYISLSSRQAYRVWGEVVGFGSDGEPCIKISMIQQLSK